jgi:hypothetical protein
MSDKKFEFAIYVDGLSVFFEVTAPEGRDVNSDDVLSAIEAIKKASAAFGYMRTEQYNVMMSPPPRGFTFSEFYSPEIGKMPVEEHDSVDSAVKNMISPDVPVTTSGRTRDVCPACGAVVTVTQDGALRVHGPIGKRCSGVAVEKPTVAEAALDPKPDATGHTPDWLDDDDVKTPVDALAGEMF